MSEWPVVSSTNTLHVLHLLLVLEYCMRPERGWEGLERRVDRKFTCDIVGCRWSYSVHVE